jgi:tRNA dimethylallyltransferase
MLNILIPVILGETASGKTSFGIQLAKDVDGEVISVDSRKVYKGLPIGTATPTGTWHNGTFLVEGVAHHLIGHLDPDQVYTAGDFAKDAHQRIDDIRARKKIPILVGGTGFYFKALAEGLPELPPRNDAFREKLARQAETQGIEPLYERLKEIDPAAAAAITHRDKHKIMRALEIFELTGQPFSLWKTSFPIALNC